MFEFLDAHQGNQAMTSRQVSLYAPATGLLLPISDVEDPIFAQKMMGDGYAIEPENGAVYAPVTGKVSVVFSTGHALGIETINGVEILLQMGMGIESLRDLCTLHIKEGQCLQAGDRVATIDLDRFKKIGKNETIMVLLTNTFELTGFQMKDSGHYQAGTYVGKVDKY